jgi:hypothetical protein
MNVHSDLKEVTMTTARISKILKTAIPIIIACALFASGGSAMAQSATSESPEGHCSNRTLFGDYGAAVEGVLLNIPGLPPEAQFRGLSMTHFDGKGNLTSVEHIVVNGTPLQPGSTAASGTYTVNPDCTGTAGVNTPNSPVPLNLALMVVRHGKEIHTVLDSNAIATVFIKVQ